MKKILFVVGSTRRQSFNRQVADYVCELLKGRAEVSCLDYADVPFFNQDIESPAPEPVTRVREAVKAADALWVFTPEYNYSYPGIVKYNPQNEMFQKNKTKRLNLQNEMFFWGYPYQNSNCVFSFYFKLSPFSRNLSLIRASASG